MMLPLQLWIIDNFTKGGETILDCMAGSGTILVACSMGRNVICVELEQKFIDIMKGNWEKIKQRGCQMGYSMGTATILQADARDLKGLLVDKCVFSPPYGEAQEGAGIAKRGISRLKAHPTDLVGKRSYMPEQAGQSEGQISSLPYGDISTIITSPAYGNNPGTPSLGSVGKDDWGNEGKDIVARRGLERGYSKHTDGQVNNLPYGSIDAVISSPPYEGSVSDNKESPLAGGNQARFGRWKDGTARKISYTQDEPCKVDAVISSPPYENQIHKGSGEWSQSREGKLLGGERSVEGKMLGVPQGEDYIKSQGNIGNLKSESYLSAMLLVYKGCYSILKGGGLMILVTKNFIRNKKQVRLDLDTIKLCEQAGFTFQDRWYRELQAQSFWRTIYYQRYPSVLPIKYEDILVFVK